MERSKNILLITMLFFGSFTQVLASSYKIRIYDAYIGNNMNQWKIIIDEMESKKNKDNLFILELVNYQYGYIAYCLGLDKDDDAKKYLELALLKIEILEKAQIEISTISAYKSAFYGFEIGLNKMKAPFIGSKSIWYSKLSMEQDPQNPMGYIQYGNSQFYMPAIFGGSKKEAVEHFRKAEKLMEKDKSKIDKDWNYLSLLALIGQSYNEMEDYQNAKIYYEKALAVEPNFLYIKLELLPDLLKKMKQ